MQIKDILIIALTYFTVLIFFKCLGKIITVIISLIRHVRYFGAWLKLNVKKLNDHLAINVEEFFILMHFKDIVFILNKYVSSSLGNFVILFKCTDTFQPHMLSYSDLERYTRDSWFSFKHLYYILCGPLVAIMQKWCEEKKRKGKALEFCFSIKETPMLS